MADRTLSKLGTGFVPVLVVVLLLLASLKLMGDATQNSTRFGELYSALLIVNAIGLVALGALIGWNLVRLLRQVREHRAGARLTVRMVTIFVVLSVTPVLVVYYFSLQFLHRGIDSWFDVRVERALDDALELSRTALGVRMRELLKQTEFVAGEISRTPEERRPIALEDARRLSGATELTLFGPKGRIIASSHVDPTSILPARPDDSILVQLRQSGSYIGLDPIGDTGLYVRVAVNVAGEFATSEPLALQALFAVTERMGSLAESVQSNFAKYRELAYLRKPLKISFTLVLSLVLLLSLFAAVWAAFFSARRMVAPLRDLVQGTMAVAAGDYETQLPAPSAGDEVGFLVDSFNNMTRRLRAARDETRRSQVQLEEQRAYLEAVLSRLSTGVLTLDGENRLVTANSAAESILDLPIGDHRGVALAHLGEAHPGIGPLAEAVLQHLHSPSGDAEWREQITLGGPEGSQVLMCSGAPLTGVDDAIVGSVIVFDDITALIQAQRHAAWSEVARRLAHEIKNPLTPIQLSAERVRHKYLDKLSGEDAAGLDRLTRTIVQQVESMKAMVNAFTEYARVPQVRLVSLDLNELVRDVLELYRNTDRECEIEAHLEAIHRVEADPDRIRQVLHNLVKNAIEAGSPSGPPRVDVYTASIEDRSLSFVEVRVRDAGPGIPPEIAPRLFEPYVTTKQKGTGLGLAIVKKIVEEHGGAVWAESNPGAGSSITVRFPAEASRIAATGAGSWRRRAV